MEKTTKINLGCGTDYKKGWINVDKDKSIKADFYSDIQSFNYPENSVDEILLSHVVMYLRPDELSSLLVVCRLWLREGGKITIETADFRKLVKIIFEESNPTILNDYGMINIFGKAGEEPHRWGWAPDRLAILLLRAGFRDLQYSGYCKELKNQNRDFRLIATK